MDAFANVLQGALHAVGIAGCPGLEISQLWKYLREKFIMAPIEPEMKLNILEYLLALPHTTLQAHLLPRKGIVKFKVISEPSGTRGLAYTEGDTVLLRKDVAVESIKGNQHLLESLNWVLADVQTCIDDPSGHLPHTEDIQVCIALSQPLREFFLTYRRSAGHPLLWNPTFPLDNIGALTVPADAQDLLDYLSDTQYALLELIGRSSYMGINSASIAEALDIQLETIHPLAKVLTARNYTITTFLGDIPRKCPEERIHQFEGFALVFFSPLQSEIFPALTPLALARELEKCKDMTAVTFDIRSVLSRQYSVVNWKNVVGTLNSQGYADSSQGVVDKKSKTIVTLLEPMHDVTVRVDLHMTMVNHMLRLIAEAGEEGVTLRALVDVLELSRTEVEEWLIRLMTKNVIGPNTSRHLLKWTTRVHLTPSGSALSRRASVENAEAEDTATPPSSGADLAFRTKRKITQPGLLKSLAVRRDKLFRSLLTKERIFAADATFRRTFKKLEEEEASDFAVNEMDKKTMLRLVDKFVGEGFCKVKDADVGLQFPVKIVALAAVDIDGPEFDSFVEAMKKKDTPRKVSAAAVEEKIVDRLVMTQRDLAVLLKYKYDLIERCALLHSFLVGFPAPWTAEAIIDALPLDICTRVLSKHIPVANILKNLNVDARVVHTVAMAQLPQIIRVPLYNEAYNAYMESLHEHLSHMANMGLVVAEGEEGLLRLAPSVVLKDTRVAEMPDMHMDVSTVQGVNNFWAILRDLKENTLETIANNVGGLGGEVSLALFSKEKHARHNKIKNEDAGDVVHDLTNVVSVPMEGVEGAEGAEGAQAAEAAPATPKQKAQRKQRAADGDPDYGPTATTPVAKKAGASSTKRKRVLRDELLDDKKSTGRQEKRRRDRETFTAVEDSILIFAAALAREMETDVDISTVASVIAKRTGTKRAEILYRRRLSSKNRDERWGKRLTLVLVQREGVGLSCKGKTREEVNFEEELDKHLQRQDKLPLPTKSMSLPSTLEEFNHMYTFELAKSTSQPTEGVSHADEPLTPRAQTLAILMLSGLWCANDDHVFPKISVGILKEYTNAEIVAAILFLRDRGSVRTMTKAKADWGLDSIEFSGNYTRTIKGEWPASMFEGVRESLGDLQEATGETLLTEMNSSKMAVILEKAATDELHWRLDFKEDRSATDMGESSGMLEVLMSSFSQEKVVATRAFDATCLVDLYLSGCDTDDKAGGSFAMFDEEDAADAVGLIPLGSWLRADDRWAPFGGATPTSLAQVFMTIAFTATQKAILSALLAAIERANEKGLTEETAQHMIRTAEKAAKVTTRSPDYLHILCELRIIFMVDANIKFVTREYAERYFVPRNLFQLFADRDEMDYPTVPCQWHTPALRINKACLRTFVEKAVAYIARHPGVPETKVVEHLRVFLTKREVKTLLLLLQDHNCIVPRTLASSSETFLFPNPACMTQTLFL